MMSLDGDGAPQDDDEAARQFGASLRNAQEGLRLVEVQEDGGAEAREALAMQADRGPLQGARACLEAMAQDAIEVLESMDRFKYFANGRP